ncbi:MAG TPA: type I DNA topoisomerase [Chloroflexota bacterium]|nr:type I DNA topoisomerase [Chloroflexota bacterium]
MAKKLMKKLVIVESPAKARTVGRYLGSGYAVLPSVGHIRDLPANRLGVDVDNEFEPRYVIPARKKEVVRELKAEAKLASAVYLATDPDREGEAISWHLVQALGLKPSTPIHRVSFNEITKDAIREAFSHPREIDRGLVDAQQARRILDRLVGYKISPLLRRKITKKGLSAGRVQSVAVRLIADREREIEAFVFDEYWTVEAEFARQPSNRRRSKPEQFQATLAQIRGEKAELKGGDQASAILRDLENANFTVGEVRRREVARNPCPPVTTSTLQQEASRKLGFTAKRTMAVAQQLYEGIQLGKEGSVGLITYMRTDSTNVSASAVTAIRDFISQNYAPEYLPPEPRVYKTRSKGAQEAHEAIRPTAIGRVPDGVKTFLAADQFRLYRLIWQRALACQMASAVLDTTSVDILTGANGDQAAAYTFRATGSVVRFPGFTTVYTEGKDEDGVEESRRTLPALTEGEQVNLVELLPEQHFTQPPPRYTEATLVKTLEEAGIGRPSTYAPIISTVQDRGYIEKVDKRLKPTELGTIVNDLLVEHFPEIVDVGFTAEMEEKLDQIARHEVASDENHRPKWVQLLVDFYQPFIRTLDLADQAIAKVDLPPEPTGEMCERCGNPLVIKWGRFGRFIACTGYPACRNAKSLMVKIGVGCPKCGPEHGGELVEKKTRRRRVFYSCSRYPECDFADWNRPNPCPVCGNAMLPAGKRTATCPVCTGTGVPDRVEPVKVAS